MGQPLRPTAAGTPEHLLRSAWFRNSEMGHKNQSWGVSGLDGSWGVCELFICNGEPLTDKSLAMGAHRFFILK